MGLLPDEKDDEDELDARMAKWGYVEADLPRRKPVQVRLTRNPHTSGFDRPVDVSRAHSHQSRLARDAGTRSRSDMCIRGRYRSGTYHSTRLRSTHATGNCISQLPLREFNRDPRVVMPVRGDFLRR